MSIAPVPLMMAATTADEKPSELNRTERWEKPGLASAPMKRLTQPMSAHICGVSVFEAGGAAGPACSAGVSA